MKLRGLILLVAGVLLLAACARTPAAPTAAPVQPSPSPQGAAPTAYPPVEAAPAGQQSNPAYPAAPAAPAVPAATVETGALYPTLADGAEVSLIQASGMLLNGEVTKVMQTHDKKAFLTLKDGRTVFALQTEMDQVLQLIKECGDPCKNIEVATE